MTADEWRKDWHYPLCHNDIEFDDADVVEVVASEAHDGDYAEEFRAAIVKLKDGRFAVVEGDCDTTGWGCQSELRSAVVATVDEAWAWLPIDIAETLRKAAAA